MTTTFGGTLKIQSSWNYKETDDFGERGKSNQNKKYEFTQADGTGENQAQWVYRAQRTVTPSTTTDDLDLAGILEDVLNIVINAATIRELIVKNLSETAGDDLLVGGAAAGGNAWGVPFNNNQDAEWTLPASGIFAVNAPLAGWAVTATSGDVLRILHGGGSNDISYEIILKGTSG